MFIQKLAGMANPPKEPVRRLFTRGWEQMGAVKRGIDTRNYGQLQDNIDYYAEKIPELKQFAKEIKNT